VCIFSRRVTDVSSTAIFARPTHEGRQIVVYRMNVSIGEDVAMVLPLPVPPGSAEDAVRFIDLSPWPKLFEELDRAFPPPPIPAWGTGQVLLGGGPRSRLAVHEVGGFEASYVPTRGEFGRLDPRFRLADEVWEALPDYHDWGFAVFKLGAMSRLVGVHPMAVEFPRREPNQLFFPTVHVHQGVVEPWARFDHWLYCQEVDPAVLERWYWAFHSARRWEASPEPLGAVVVERVAGIVRPDRPCHRVALHGAYPNRDVLI
jgi:hypothetical protein